MKSALMMLVLLLSISTFAADPAPPFVGEAEAGAIVITGNSDSENYAAKLKMTYTQDKNVYTAFGRFIKSEANGVESAKNWEAGVRYERQLTDYLGVFVGQKIESDIYAGYLQRDSTDIGLQYSLIKRDDMNWIVEAGYRYSKTQPRTGSVLYENYLRLYTEFNKSFDKTFSFKYWIEYLPNMTDGDAYQINTEPSINAMLNSIFSLKLGYLVQYQNVPPSGGKYTTTTTTLNLVAKF